MPPIKASVAQILKTSQFAIPLKNYAKEQKAENRFVKQEATKKNNITPRRTKSAPRKTI